MLNNEQSTINLCKQNDIINLIIEFKWSISIGVSLHLHTRNERQRTFLQFATTTTAELY